MQYRVHYTLWQQKADTIRSFPSIFQLMPWMPERFFCEMTTEKFIKEALLKDLEASDENPKLEGKLLIAFKARFIAEEEYDLFQIVKHWVPIYAWQTETQDSVSTQ